MPAGNNPTLCRSARKAAGVFYTPTHIVDYILERTLAKHDIVQNPAPKVLDPACGSGNFLVRAYDMLLAKLTDNLPVLQDRYAARQYRIRSGSDIASLDGRRYWRRENLHYHIISHCLFGADVDEQAVRQAERRLGEKDVGRWCELASNNLIVCDSLVRWENPRDVSRKDAAGAVQHRLAEFWTRQYDCVIGNPPYVSFGLNRVGKMTADHSAYLRAKYPYSAQYKLSYYALFLERGITALKSGGFLGFITPDSYLLGRYYSKIREYILATCSIQELTLVADKVFNGVLVGVPAITILRKNTAVPAKPADTVLITKLADSDRPVISFQYSQNYFSEQVYKRFRLFFSAQDKAIVEKMEQAPRRFGDLTKIRTGMRSLSVQADIKSKNKLGDTWRPGLTSSAQIIPFGLVYQEDWLDVNPAKLNKGGWDATVMAGNKIFLRQTGDCLIAAVDCSGLYHLNNIHSIAVLQAGISLEYLVCLLNSRLLNFYYHTVTLEKGRPMAQVDIETVEKLPLVINPGQHGKLTRIGGQLETLTAGLTPYAEKTPDSCRLLTEFTEVYNQMNQVIYEIYGLPASDIAHIEHLYNNGEAGMLLGRQKRRGRQI
ncbi:Eco57I restriction-modification methylase domain-containing protein [Sporomusa aerivorans]|uniref:Eco57I restriction-modification methylase domain-containing protein n=1 Tax=Sporomusa aerivorans TaxID=204936 RepID=UPI00352BA781